MYTLEQQIPLPLYGATPSLGTMLKLPFLKYAINMKLYLCKITKHFKIMFLKKPQVMKNSQTLERLIFTWPDR